MSQLKWITLKEGWGGYKAEEEILVDSARAATLVKEKVAKAGRKPVKVKTKGKGDFVVSSGTPTLRVLGGGKE